MGYSKAGSTFLQSYFQAHPQVFIDRIAARHILSPDRVSFSEDDKRKATEAKVYVSMQERLCESVIYEQPDSWPKLKWNSVSWNNLVGVIDVDPKNIASAWGSRFPGSKVLMVIRDQVSWLSSAYSYYLDNLRPGNRSFLDFCATPKGMVLLRAGHYDLTIQAYFEEFGTQNVKVLRFEQLKEDRHSFLQEICEFLDLDPVPYTAPAQNAGRSQIAATVLKHLPAWVPDTPGLRNVVKKLLPIVRASSKHRLSPKEERFIRSFYALSNCRTSRLLTKTISDPIQEWL